MTTPAQEAKEYAAANGFTIAPEGRRYRVTHISGHEFDRSGYAACLNEMQFIIGTLGDAKRDAIANLNMGTAALVGVLAPVATKKPVRCKGPKCTSNGETPHSAECNALHDATVAGVIEQKPINAHYVTLTDTQVDPNCRVYAATPPRTSNESTGAVKPYVITARNKTTGARFQMAQGPFLTRDEAIKRVRHLFNTVPSYRNAALQVEYRP